MEATELAGATGLKAITNGTVADQGNRERVAREWRHREAAVAGATTAAGASCAVVDGGHTGRPRRQPDDVRQLLQPLHTPHYSSSWCNLHSFVAIAARGLAAVRAVAALVAEVLLRMGPAIATGVEAARYSTAADGGPASHYCQTYY